MPGVVRIDIRVRPKEAGGDEDKGWYTTVTGIQGDAVGIPNGFQPNWGVQGPLGQAGMANPQGLGQTNPQGLGTMQSAPMVTPAPGPSSQGLGSDITLGNDQPSSEPETPPRFPSW